MIDSSFIFIFMLVNNIKTFLGLPTNVVLQFLFLIKVKIIQAHIFSAWWISGRLCFWVKNTFFEFYFIKMRL